MLARRRRALLPKRDPRIERRPDGLARSHLLTTPWLVVSGCLFALVLMQTPAPASTLLPSLTPAQPITAQRITVASDEEVRLLAATAWAEARSEGEHGMRAVAHVMVNRVGPRFGDDLETVIRSPKQFSAWNRGDPNRPLVLNPERYARGGVNRVTWETAQNVAREVLEGRSVDPTAGALFYHTRAVRPYWSRYGVGRREIGAHVFYTDVPDQPRARHRTRSRVNGRFEARHEAAPPPAPAPSPVIEQPSQAIETTTASVGHGLDAAL